MIMLPAALRAVLRLYGASSLPPTLWKALDTDMPSSSIDYQPGPFQISIPSRSVPHLLKAEGLMTSDPNRSTAITGNIAWRPTTIFESLSHAAQDWSAVLLFNRFDGSKLTYAHGGGRDVAIACIGTTGIGCRAPWTMLKTV